jgi:hypothetical protein
MLYHQGFLFLQKKLITNVENVFTVDNGKHPVNGIQKEAGGYGKSLKEDYR